MSSIRITHTPPGFAPQHIREQWVGVQILLVTADELRKNPLSGFKLGSENDDGHLVLRSKAIEALRGAGKEEAVAYWSSLPLGMYLQFKKEVCEICE
jgi:hypothetical protein